MNNNDTIKTALGVALRAHNDQVDKAGELYILHPIRVFEAVRADNGDVFQQAAALLHDVVEDTPVSCEYLANWFSPAIVQLVRALTRPISMPYDEYLDQVIACPAAIMIKKHDLTDNLGRIQVLIDQGKMADAERLHAKYVRGLKRMWDAGAPSSYGSLRRESARL